VAWAIAATTATSLLTGAAIDVLHKHRHDRQWKSNLRPPGVGAFFTQPLVSSLRTTRHEGGDSFVNEASAELL
jgi:hypothetical protein